MKLARESPLGRKARRACYTAARLYYTDQYTQAFSLRFAQGERGAERLVPALRSAPGEPGTRDGSPFGGPLSAALAFMTWGVATTDEKGAGER